MKGSLPPPNSPPPPSGDFSFDASFPLPDHVFVRECAAAYLAGGLTLLDRERFEAHIATCQACAAAVEETRQMDETLRGLFDGAGAIGIEDRIINHLRENTVKRNFKLVLVKRIGLGLAAAVVLGATGVMADYAVKHDLLGTMQKAPGKAQAAVDLKKFLPGNKSTPMQNAVVDAGKMKPADKEASATQPAAQIAWAGEWLGGMDNDIDGKDSSFYAQPTHGTVYPYAQTLKAYRAPTLTTTETGVPVLSKMPGLNRMFTNRSFTVSNGTFTQETPVATGVPGSLAGTTEGLEIVNGDIYFDYPDGTQSTKLAEAQGNKLKGLQQSEQAIRENEKLRGENLALTKALRMKNERLVATEERFDQQKNGPESVALPTLEELNIVDETTERFANAAENFKERQTGKIALGAGVSSNSGLIEQLSRENDGRDSAIKKKSLGKEGELSKYQLEFENLTDTSGEFSKKANTSSLASGYLPGRGIGGETQVNGGKIQLGVNNALGRATGVTTVNNGKLELSDLAQADKAARERGETVFNLSLDRSRQTLNSARTAADYEVAIRDTEDAIRTIDNNKRFLDDANYQKRKDEALALREQVVQLKNATQTRHETEADAEARIKELKEASVRGIQREQQIAILQRDADTLMAQQQFDEAKATLKHVLVLEPNNGNAKAKLALAEDTKLFRTFEKLNQVQGEEFLKQAIIGKEVTSPQMLSVGLGYTFGGKPVASDVPFGFFSPDGTLANGPVDYTKTVDSNGNAVNTLKLTGTNSGSATGTGTITLTAGSSYTGVATDGGGNASGGQPVQIAQNTPPAQQTPPPQPRKLTPEQLQVRKVIRNGTVEYEVRNFDDVQVLVTKLVEEESGFIASTNSDRLANGKMRGTMVVRVPPDRLDTLVLKLRGIGELKSQQIGSSDVSKQYTDMESKMRALRAMEDRLLDIIKNNKGSVKELVEAETKLSENRQQLEQIVGELKYYDNLIAMATLTVSAYEKDIRQAAAAIESERVDVGIETEDVEAKYVTARKVIEDAKGRIVSSALKRLEGDQLNAVIVCRVPQDAAGPVMDQLRQLGRVARYTRDKVLQTDPNSPANAPKTEVRDSEIQISMYNLANIPPRETTYITIAVPDVQEVYAKVLELVRADVPAADDGKLGLMKASPTGKVVNSGISGQKADQMSGTIQAYVKASEFKRVMDAIKSVGGVTEEVVASSMVTSSDIAGTTLEKKGIQLTLQSTASVSPRETTNLLVAVPDVQAVYNKMMEAMNEEAALPGGDPAKPVLLPTGRVVNSAIAGQRADLMSASLTLHVRTPEFKRVVEMLKTANGETLSSNVTTSTDTTGTSVAKKGISLSLVATASVMPKETTVLSIAVPDVTEMYNKLIEATNQDAPLPGGDPANPVMLPTGRVVSSAISGQRADQVSASLLLHVRASEFTRMLALIKAVSGGKDETLSSNISTNNDTSSTSTSKKGIQLSLTSTASVYPRETFTIAVAAKSVKTLRDQIKALDSAGKVRLVGDSFNEPNAGDVSAQMVLQVNDENRRVVEGLLESPGVAELSRSISRQDDSSRTARKVGYVLTLSNAEKLPQVRVSFVAVEVSNVKAAMEALRSAGVKFSARELDAVIQRKDTGEEVGQILLDVSSSAGATLADEARAMGEIKGSSVRKTANMTENALSHEHVAVQFTSKPPIVGANQNIESTVRDSLSAVMTALHFSLYILLTGVLAIAPWLLLAWVFWRFYKRRKAKVAVAK